MTDKVLSSSFNHIVFPSVWGYAVAQLFEALHYMSEGRGFDSRCGQWDVSLTYSFWPHYGLGSIQPLTEMSTRGIFWG
jgi:hypothetical protein